MTAVALSRETIDTALVVLNRARRAEQRQIAHLEQTGSRPSFSAALRVAQQNLERYNAAHADLTEALAECKTAAGS